MPVGFAKDKLEKSKLSVGSIILSINGRIENL